MKTKLNWTPGLITGLSILIVLIFTAIVAPIFLTTAAQELTGNAALPASPSHPLGTDDFGRDNLARALVATRLTLLMALSATSIAIGFGLCIGIGVWFLPKRLRQSALRLLETMVAYPTLIFALVIAAVLGPGTSSAIFAIGIAGIPGFARVVSNLTASLMQKDYVNTARLMGVGKFKLTTRHLLPNMAEPLLIVATTNFAASLVDLSGLSFIGLGVQSPDYDFGRLLNDSLSAIYTQPLQAVGPSIMIVLTGLAATMIGDGLAGSVDPRYRMRGIIGGLRRSYSDNKYQMPGDVEVAVQNLVIKKADGGTLVDGVNLHINKGEVVGLVGESGSGKSLTAMAIAKLSADDLSVSADQLRVADLDLLEKNSPRQLATSISVVYQDPGTTVNPTLKVGQQLTEVQRQHLRQTKREAWKKMERALGVVHITEPQRRMQQHPHELSGGMRQRAMIASAIASGADLLIADEPTTALDVTVQAEVLKQFKELNRTRKTSMLFISHDIAVVEAMCDRILVMRNGKIVEELTKTQLAQRDVQHPYTQSLLAATPELKYDRGASHA